MALFQTAPFVLLPAQILRDALEALMLHVGDVSQDGCHERPFAAAYCFQFGIAEQFGRPARFLAFIVRCAHQKLLHFRRLVSGRYLGVMLLILPLMSNVTSQNSTWN